MIRLHVNIDHVATLRNQRDTPYPDPVEAAKICLGAGAHGITVHLREDRRHIRDRDVERLRVETRTFLNLEMAATREMTRFAEEVRPDVITLVPERREERTTEGGLDVIGGRDAVREVAAMCHAKGVRLSLFIEADFAQIEASREIGATQVEFHTGHYAHLVLGEEAAKVPAELERFRSATERAHALGLAVAAGHGLHTGNVAPIVRLPHMEELNIGHAIVSDAVLVGLDAAVRRMNDAIERAARASD